MSKKCQKNVVFMSKILIVSLLDLYLHYAFKKKKYLSCMV